jgi:2-C-methyl-D-erythritol 4-phosphate cytidylyltransferase
MNVALIMAGGSGTRMQSKEKKQFIDINGKPIIAYTLAKFCSHPRIDKVIIVSHPEDICQMHNICKMHFPGNDITITAGGKTRQISALNGIKICPADTRLVLIHDAVRPFLEENLISRLIDLAKLYNAVIPCSPVRFTIKRVLDHKIMETIPRHSLYNAHTPQVFDYKLIYKYHLMAENIDYEFTDDSSILEYFQIPVYIHTCQDTNQKITTTQDLITAKFLLK